MKITINPLDGYEIVTDLHGGMMNVSKIVKNNFGEKFVLYVPTEQSASMVDRKLELECVTKAIEAGIAPKNVYFDCATGIKINEYIEGSSLNFVEEFDAKKVGELISKYHKCDASNIQFYDPFTRLKEYENERLNLGIETNQIYEDLKKTMFKNLSLMKEDDLVLSHNDFQRSNIIKSLNNEYFLIDYEFAMRNYAMYDIACFGNDSVDDCIKLLFALCPMCSTEKLKKLLLWRMFVSLQWFNVALIKYANGENEKTGHDFMKVAQHFLDNCYIAKTKFLEISKE